MKTTTRQLRNSINRSLVRAFLLIALTIGWLALAPHTRAVCQEGCLTNSNTALGEDALISLTTGGFNTANGNQALQNNATGSNNTANGNQALLSNTSGGSNTGVGGGALLFNTDGHANTAIGASALQNNTNGNNTAIGFGALLNNNIGHDNIALGFKAGIRNLTGNNNIDIGNPGLSQDFKTIRIGEVGKHLATFIAGISGAPVADGVGVIVGSDGKLGTIVSSARFKEAVKPMDKASEAILALQPVTFRYKHEIDPASIPQFGLVAEEVEKVNPDLVVRDADGKAYTVRYEAVNAMLLNEFLKEHKKVEEQQATIAELKSIVAQQQKGFQSRLAEQQKQIEALTAGLQKVSAQVEASQTAQQVVVDNH
jgi:Chaperone of endosialidase